MDSPGDVVCSVERNKKTCWRVAYTFSNTLRLEPLLKGMVMSKSINAEKSFTDCVPYQSLTGTGSRIMPESTCPKENVYITSHLPRDQIEVDGYCKNMCYLYMPYCIILEALVDTH